MNLFLKCQVFKRPAKLKCTDENSFRVSIDKFAVSAIPKLDSKQFRV